MASKFCTLLIILLISFVAFPESYAPIELSHLHKVADKVVLVKVVEINCESNGRCTTIVHVEKDLSESSAVHVLKIAPYNMFEKDETYIVFLKKSENCFESTFKVVYGGRGSFNVSDNKVIFGTQNIVNDNQRLDETEILLTQFMNMAKLR